MNHPVKALTIACAILGGGCMLLVGLINLADPSYGGEFLRMMSSVYPGADTTRTLGRILLGGVYGFVGGAIGGFLLAWLFQAFGEDHSTQGTVHSH
jgi:cytochrome c biogenesis protein CcdA